MLHLPSFLLILSASSTSAASSESAQFASLLSARDPPEDLARELLSLIEDDAFSRAAKVMVGAETFHAAATADAFNTVVGHATSPLTYLLDQWSRAIDFKWPAPVMHGALFDAAIAFGATGGGDACAVLTAARTRNVGALRALLIVTPSRDVTACLLNTTRANLFAFASSSPSPGTARLFFRGGRVAIGASNTSAEAAAAMLALRDSDGVLFSPSLWPTAFKSALEAASPPVELDLLAPFFGVGFTGEAPRPDSGDAEAHLDAMWAAAEDGAPLPSVWAHRASAQDLLMARDPGTGATPILKACASGRTAVLARLLALLPNSVTPSSDALHGSPAFGGATCAHLAAASGDAKTLATLIARFPNAISDALHGRDAHGRTPCDIAAAGGGLLAPATVFLRDAGACGDTAVKVESLAHCPIVQRLDDRPELAVAARGFDVREHVLGGWRMLSPSDLASLSLPPTFLSQNTLDEYERHGRTLLRDSMLRRGARRGNTTEDLETESPRFAFACDPSELPASALREDPTTVDALVRDFISTQTPFVVRAAYDPGEALSTDDGPHSGVPTIHRVYDAFTNLMVDTGALPYANAYGHGGNRMSANAFMERYMGSFTSINSNGTIKEAAIESTLRGENAGSFTGPGSDLPRPPYIFDGKVLGDSSSAAARAFSNFSLPRVFKKDRAHQQLALGPPLSGAMPHFHGAAVNVLLVGVKLWVLVPPYNAAFVDAHAAAWFRDLYLPAHTRDVNGRAPSVGQGSVGSWHYIFTQAPGDLVWVPPYWGHAVLNLADTLAIALE